MRHLLSGVTCQGEIWLHLSSKFPLESILGYEKGAQKTTYFHVCLPILRLIVKV